MYLLQNDKSPQSQAPKLLDAEYTNLKDQGPCYLVADFFSYPQVSGTHLKIFKFLILGKKEKVHNIKYFHLFSFHGDITIVLF